MFDQLRSRITLEFSIIVFVLLVIYGVLYVFIDYRDRINELHINILQDAQTVAQQFDGDIDVLQNMLSERDDFRTRIFNKHAELIYDGGLFEGYPGVLSSEPWVLHYGNDAFRVMSIPLMANEVIQGYVEIGEVYHFGLSDLRERLFIIILESGAIALLVYFFGYLYANRTLQPAVAMHHKLEQFSREASHELKTPLAVACSSLDLALRDSNPHQHIKNAKKALYRASNLVDRLLYLAKLTSFTLQKEPVDVSDIAQEIVDQYLTIAEKKQVQIELYNPEKMIIDADEGYLRSLIENVVGNAVKFSNAGSRIYIAVRQHALSVKDQGKGIAKEKIDRLCDPFFQADVSRSTTGHGLGLHIVKKIADAHDWTLSIESIEGVGTEVRVSF